MPILARAVTVGLILVGFLAFAALGNVSAGDAPKLRVMQPIFINGGASKFDASSETCKSGCTTKKRPKKLRILIAANARSNCLIGCEGVSEN